jgi:Zn-dependent alcohol dehydrogenase
MGATHAVDPKNDDVLAALRDAGGGGMDYALDTSGIPAVMKTAVDALLPNRLLKFA